MGSIWEMSVVVALGAAVVGVVAACGLLRRDALAAGPRRDVGLGPYDLAVGLALMGLGIVALNVVGMRLGLMRPAGQDDGEPISPRRLLALSLLSQVMTQLPIALLLVTRAARLPGGLKLVGLVPTRPWRDAKYGVLGLLAALPVVMATSVIAVTAVVAVIVGTYFDQPEPAIGHEMLKAMMEADSPWVLWAMLAVAVVVAPLFEEMMFRGLLQTSLLGLFGWARRWPVVLACAALFALAHGDVPWQVKPGLFVLGVLLGWLYERTGSLWPGVIVHAGFNAVNSAIAILASAAAAGGPPG